MIVIRIPTKLGAIEVRRGGVRRRPFFEWQGRHQVAPIGPFATLIECLADLVSAYEVNLHWHEKAAQLHPAPPAP